MKTAIIGAGLAGVALAWQLLELRPNWTIHLYDTKGIAGGASGVAAGLVAPFGGARSTLIPEGHSCLAATLRLVDSAEKIVRHPLKKKGILRPALTDIQVHDFQKQVLKYPNELEWWEQEKCTSAVPELSPSQGLWVHNAYQIDTKRYLEALWQGCVQKGAQLIVHQVMTWQELDSYNAAFATMGADTLLFPSLNQIPAKRNKGQMAGFISGEKPLPFALNSHAYCVSDLFNTQLRWAGATYEHDEPLDEAVDLEMAWKLLLPRLAPMLPGLKEIRPTIGLAGMRLTTRDYKPYLAQVGQKRWVLAGLGSKGILYHAYYAEKLAKLAIYNSNEGF